LNIFTHGAGQETGFLSAQSLVIEMSREGSRLGRLAHNGCRRILQIQVCPHAVGYAAFYDWNACAESEGVKVIFNSGGRN
jgi:hypothetical protein